MEIAVRERASRGEKEVERERERLKGKESDGERGRELLGGVGGVLMNALDCLKSLICI